MGHHVKLFQCRSGATELQDVVRTELCGSKSVHSNMVAENVVFEWKFVNNLGTELGMGHNRSNNPKADSRGQHCCRQGQ